MRPIKIIHLACVCGSLVGCASIQSQPTSAASAQFAALDKALASDAYPKTNSVIVMQGGDTLFERYLNEGAPDALSNTRSATKTVTALAVGAALADGKIASLDDRAFDYLKDLAPFKNDSAAKQAITIRDLLTMSSSLECNDNDPDSIGNEENMYPHDSWVRWAVDLPAMEGPQQWRYCTGGVVLLGAVIENAAGEPADEYIDWRILAPIGVTTGKWFHSPSGETMTGGGLELRAKDLAALGRLILQRGAWKGDQIIAPAFIDDMLTIHATANAEQDYGYLVWRRDYQTECDGISAWYMAGNGGNAVVMAPSLDATIVVARTRYNTRGMHQETTDLIERFVLPALACRP